MWLTALLLLACSRLPCLARASSAFGIAEGSTLELGVQPQRRKRLGIIFVGKSDGRYNYKTAAGNYQRRIFDHFRSWEIDNFLFTDPGGGLESVQQLVADFSPYQYHVARRQFQNGRFGEALDLVVALCEAEKLVYDAFLIIRFDLLIVANLEEFEIKLDKPNLVSGLEGGELICDNFYLFGGALLSTFGTMFRKAVLLDRLCDPNDMPTDHGLGHHRHWIKPCIEKALGPVNFLLNDKKPIAGLRFYLLLHDAFGRWGDFSAQRAKAWTEQAGEKYSSMLEQEIKLIKECNGTAWPLKFRRWHSPAAAPQQLAGPKKTDWVAVSTFSANSSATQLWQNFKPSPWCPPYAKCDEGGCIAKGMDWIKKQDCRPETKYPV